MIANAEPNITRGASRPTSRDRPIQHTTAGNPVAKARAKIAVFVWPEAAQAATAPWEEF